MSLQNISNVTILISLPVELIYIDTCTNNGPMPHIYHCRAYYMQSSVTFALFVLRTGTQTYVSYIHVHVY